MEDRKGDLGEDAKLFIIEVLSDPEAPVAQTAAGLLIQFPDGIEILKKEDNFSKEDFDYCNTLISSKEALRAHFNENKQK